MQTFRWPSALLVVLVATLAGCATPPQPPVELSAAGATRAKSSRVGVAVSALPKPDTQFPGAGCLLCIAVASGVHSKLTTQVQTFSTAELEPLKNELVQLLAAQGWQPVQIDAPLLENDAPARRDAQPGQSRRDYSALKARHRIDRLLVVHIDALGVWRNYAGYVPQGSPFALVKGEALLVDLSTHGLDWYLPINVNRQSEGEWDEAPKYPGLTNAYYQAIEEARDIVRKPFRGK